MKMKLLAAVGAVVFAQGATAAPVTFFGEDLSTNSANQTTSRPNADAARSSFFSNLQGVGTETFEGFNAGAMAPLPISFAGAGTATLSGTGTVLGSATAGRYAISGTKFFQTNGTFSISFSNPVSAFGFYGTDLGDIGASLVLTLTGSNGVSTLAVPNVVGSTANGSALYFGFYDTANTYSAISFAGAGNDIFGFDDFSIGSRAQVAPVTSAVPEAATWAMMMVGLGVVGGSLRRRRSVTTRVRFA